MWRNLDFRFHNVYKLLLPICSSEVQILIKRLATSADKSLDVWISIADNGTFLIHERIALMFVLRKTKLRNTKLTILKILNTRDE